ncbi:MAG: pyrimidine 5'-nucleotidase [Pseudomonadota bacterium]
MPADAERLPPQLQDRRVWVFDLDNTLYPAECDLFAEIDQRMTDFVARFLRLPRDQARATQKQYYAEHGTTLNGLMTLHGMAPDEFLAHVHEVDLSPLPKTPDLAEAISALPGQKFVYTNGSRGHAQRVTDYMGLAHVFDGSFAIEDSAFQPKPALSSYQAFIAQFGIDPHQAVFFEDLARNLAPAHIMGFATVLVQSEKDWSHEPAAARPAGIGDDLPTHIDYVTGDLTQFVRSILA